MTCFLLVRHGHTGHMENGISGRSDAKLSREGVEEVERLAGSLKGVKVAALFCSPLPRTLSTAEMLGEAMGVEPVTAELLQELEFGCWTGRTREELERDSRWKVFNTFRSGTRIPGGETMLEAQARMVKFMEEVRERHPAEVVAMVSHGDPIRAALTFFLGMPLDLWLRLEISTASLSILDLNDPGPRLRLFNFTGKSLGTGIP